MKRSSPILCDPLVLIAKAGLEEDPARADFLRHYAVEHFGEQSATTWERAAEMTAGTNATGTGADVCRECDQAGSKPGVGALAQE